jgi:hypothetical protein
MMPTQTIQNSRAKQSLRRLAVFAEIDGVAGGWTD